MKKRLLSLLLAVCTAVSLLVLPAEAASKARFSDVSDAATLTNVEILRLMGVMDGYNDGTFRPNQQLNRAQFCKMATFAMHKQQSLGLHGTVTVFPDVKPSHWAAPYINLASRTTVGGGSASGATQEGEKAGHPIIAGFPDGKFHPERTINLGQAATILLRILGYQDSEIGGVWPDSYMATASSAGLLKGLPRDGHAALTRAQAARLFVNLLEAKKAGGGTLYTFSEEADFASIDGGSGTLKLMGGMSYPMANPVESTTLTGTHGRVVLDGETALTFLPIFSTGTGSGAGAIVLYEDKSGVGLTELAGNSNYKIYKNGTPASIADLRKYDVATYYPDTNSIIVCDTRVTVLYEASEPNPQAPTKIRALGGTEFQILPTAVDSLKKFKPGDQITLLLSSDGRVAGAVKAGTGDARGNAIGLVKGEGKVERFCGSRTIEINAKSESNQEGKVVFISASEKGNVSLQTASGGIGGTLYVAEHKLGNKKLAEGVQIYEGGKQIGLSQLSRGEIPDSQIRYARLNWAGEVDLVVIDHSTGDIYGRVFYEIDYPTSSDPDEESKLVERVGVEYGSGKRTKTVAIKYGVNNGDYVVARMNADETGFVLMQKLSKLDDISWKAWIGKTTVNAGGRNYEVPADVLCYNLDSKDWVTLDQAMAYAETADLYVKDGVVRIIEVRS